MLVNLDEYTRLQDDGCPNCHEHIDDVCTLHFVIIPVWIPINYGDLFFHDEAV